MTSGSDDFFLTLNVWSFKSRHVELGTFEIPVVGGVWRFLGMTGIRAGVHFVLRGKNAGNFELLSLISKSYATVVSVPGGGTILCSSSYDICRLLSYKFQE